MRIIFHNLRINRRRRPRSSSITLSDTPLRLSRPCCRRPPIILFVPFFILILFRQCGHSEGSWDEDAVQGHVKVDEPGYCDGQTSDYLDDPIEGAKRQALFPDDIYILWIERRRWDAYLNVSDGSWAPNWAVAMKKPVRGKVKLHHPIDHSTLRSSACPKTQMVRVEKRI